MVYNVTHISSDLLTFTSHLININTTYIQCYAPQPLSIPYSKWTTQKISLQNKVSYDIRQSSNGEEALTGLVPAWKIH